MDSETNNNDIRSYKMKAVGTGLLFGAAGGSTVAFFFSHKKVIRSIILGGLIGMAAAFVIMSVKPKQDDDTK